MSLVHAAFSCREGANRTTVKGGASGGSTTILKSRCPNTCPEPFAVQLEWDVGEKIKPLQTENLNLREINSQLRISFLFFFLLRMARIQRSTVPQLSGILIPPPEK